MTELAILTWSYAFEVLEEDKASAYVYLDALEKGVALMKATVKEWRLECESRKPSRPGELRLGDLTLFFGKVSPLSNFHPAEFKGPDGLSYKCVEQYYQCKKAAAFGDDESLAAIRRTANPARIKCLGRKVQGYDQKVWRAERAEKVMREALLHKFTQNPSLKEYLLSSSPRLGEANGRDSFFGTGLYMRSARVTEKYAGSGKNLMGQLLMSLRDDFLRSESRHRFLL